MKKIELHDLMVQSFLDQNLYKNFTVREPKVPVIFGIPKVHNDIPPFLSDL